jgi:hypothetical protein
MCAALHARWFGNVIAAGDDNCSHPHALMFVAVRGTVPALKDTHAIGAHPRTTQHSSTVIRVATDRNCACTHCASAFTHMRAGGLYGKHIVQALEQDALAKLNDSRSLVDILQGMIIMLDTEWLLPSERAVYFAALLSP